ncbi:MAG: hypothetical protein ABWZ76_13660 [Acidimicrobiales bacterium]
MDVVTDRRYQVGLPPAELWSLLTQTHRYRTWWPWLRRFDGDGVVLDQSWCCSVQPPLSYPVRFAVLIDEVWAPFGASGSLTGDVVGTARIDITATSAGSEARLVARLAPGNGFLRAASRLAGPLVRLGHDWVLDTAARQFMTQAVGSVAAPPTAS